MSALFKLKNGTNFLLTEAPGGIYNSAQLKKIAELCEDDLAIVKATEDQRLGLFVIDDNITHVTQTLSEIGLGVRHYRDGLHQAVACLGELCQDHEQDALGTAMDLAQKLEDLQSQSPLRIGINGCFQCCTPCHTLDISLVGDSSGYRISLGGKSSQVPEFAAFMAEHVPTELVGDLLKKVVQLFNDKAAEGETLHDVIERCGVAEFVACLAPYSQDAHSGDDVFHEAAESDNDVSRPLEADESHNESEDVGDADDLDLLSEDDLDDLGDLDEDQLDGEHYLSEDDSESIESQSNMLDPDELESSEGDDLGDNITLSESDLDNMDELEIATDSLEDEGDTLSITDESNSGNSLDIDEADLELDDIDVDPEESDSASAHATDSQALDEDIAMETLSAEEDAEIEEVSIELPVENEELDEINLDFGDQKQIEHSSDEDLELELDEDVSEFTSENPIHSSDEELPPEDESADEIFGADQQVPPDVQDDDQSIHEDEFAEVDEEYVESKIIADIDKEAEILATSEIDDNHEHREHTLELLNEDEIEEEIEIDEDIDADFSDYDSSLDIDDTTLEQNVPELASEQDKPGSNLSQSVASKVQFIFSGVSVSEGTIHLSFDSGAFIDIDINSFTEKKSFNLGGQVCTLLRAEKGVHVEVDGMKLFYPLEKLSVAS